MSFNALFAINVHQIVEVPLNFDRQFLTVEPMTNFDRGNRANSSKRNLKLTKSVPLS